MACDSLRTILKWDKEKATHYGENSSRYVDEIMFKLTNSADLLYITAYVFTDLRLLSFLHKCLSQGKHMTILLD